MDNTFVKSVTTPGSLTGINRGTYLYKLTHVDTKDFDSAKTQPQEFLDLKGWASIGKGVSCTLVPKQSKLEALPCNLE
jgi:hypothetical protein